VSESTQHRTGTGRARIRDVVESDLAEIARLHIDAFPESVLGRVGVEAVRRSYAWQLNGPHELTALVGVVDDDRIAGFLFGGVFRGSTIGFLRKEKWFLARQVLRHPGLVRGRLGRDRFGLALRLLTRRFRASAPAAENPAAVPVRSFGVLAIAVDPEVQGSGVGRLLMAEATERARAADFVGMHLSVHPDNERGLAFYTSLGWTPSPEPDGTWVGRMRYDLTTAVAD